VQKLEAVRGKPSDNSTQMDYNFHIENDAISENGLGSENARISITQRRRGSPIDKVVSELMILVNSEWGKHLAEHGFVGIYRTQQNGKVKMSTVAAPHQGLGVAQYMWSSSPLRRYVDMVNQRQIIAMLRDGEPAYPKNDPALYATMRDFDTMYGIYGEFQKSMERYWCLRWLQQEKDKLVALPQTLDETTSHSTRLPKTAAKSLVTSRVAGNPLLNPLPLAGEEAIALSPSGGKLDRGLEANESLRELLVDAIVLRENLVKVTGIPLVFRVPSLPESLAANTRVQLAIVSIDLLDLNLDTRFVATIEDTV